jgi:FLVCR family feline leukemia virus subgroup C receptor-related protein
MYLCISFTCLNCICTCMGAVVSSVTSPYDYTGLDNAIFGAVFIVCGVLGTIVLSILLDRYHRYKLTLLLTSIVSIVALAFSQLTLPSKSTTLFAINVAFLGFSGIPVAPVANAFAVELTYPIPEAMSNGMMNVPNIMFGFVMGITAGFLCQVSPRYAMLMFLFNSVIGCIACLFIKEELRRIKP